MYSVKLVKSQSLSWIWALIVVTLGLITSAWMFIIYQNAQTRLSSMAPSIGANVDHVNLLNTLFNLAPIAMLIGFSLFILIVSITTRGGDRIVG